MVNEAIKYIYPKEGALLWIDSLVIPKGAKNIDNALAFINYLLKPEVSKVISEEIGYASPNAKTLELLDEKTRNNRIVYPNDEDLVNSELQLDVGESLPVYEKYWEMLKTN
jgi:spermidine/putrescine transport system substrate-binding protein